MASTFPTSLDSLSTGSANDTPNKDTHPLLHNDANDAINQLETKVGIDGATGPTSHDYKLSGVTGTDKAVSLTGTETLTNKTLTTPAIETAILDENGNEIIEFNPTGTATDHIKISNAPTGTDVSIEPAGISTNVGLQIKAKGTGKLKLGDDELEWPDADGSVSQVLKTDGSAALGWTDQSAAASCVTLIPKPQIAIGTDELVTSQKNVNTIMSVGQLSIPYQITVNKVSFQTTTVDVAGTMKVALYAEDGQSQAFSFTTANIAASNTLIITTLASPVTLAPGIYYIAIVPVGTADITIFVYRGYVTGESYGIKASVTGEPVLEGTVTVTAGTLPATITPSGVTGADYQTLHIRLDN